MPKPNHEIGFLSTKLKVEGLESRLTPAVKIQFDYSLDTSNFFNTQAKKDVLQAAADAITSRFSDSLAAIVPSGGNSWEAFITNPATGSVVTRTNLTVPADTIIIYVGARQLSGNELGEASSITPNPTGDPAWIDLVNYRGQAGAALATPTDYGLWGGAITFRRFSNFYYGLDPTGIASDQQDFFAVAQHEIIHVLGFGQSPVYTALSVGGGYSGPQAQAVYGGDVPLSVLPDGTAPHWGGWPKADIHPIMLPFVSDQFPRGPVTALDWAGLDDLGWDVTPPVRTDTRVTAASQPGAAGQDFTLTAKVTAADGSVPTGTVDFYWVNATIKLGTADLVNGAATLPFQPGPGFFNKPPTPDDIYVLYRGTTTYGASGNEAIVTTPKFGGNVPVQVFTDTNRNGVRDAGEPLVSGNITRAYVDINNNGRLDSQESDSIGFSSDGTGGYSFASYQFQVGDQPTIHFGFDGRYVIRLDANTLGTQTATTAPITVDVSGGQTLATQFFGIAEGTSPPTSPPPTSPPPTSPPPPAVPPTVNPSRLLGVTTIAVGDTPNLRFLNANHVEQFQTAPFGGTTTPARTASADFNADGTPDAVVGTGPGGVTLVRILDGKTQQELFRTQPFESSFVGGVYLAAGDVNGDGRPDLAISPDEGGGPRVDVYSGAGFGKLASFFGIDDTNFRGGARTSVADLNGDGTSDLIVVAGFGGGPRVAAFDGASLTSVPRKIFADFFAFEQALRNGVFVTAGDVNGDGFADLIAGGGPGGGPRVLAFDGQSLLRNEYQTLANFFGGDVESRSGVRLAVKNLDNDDRADLVIAAGDGTSAKVIGYLGKSIAAGGTPPVEFELTTFPGAFVG